MVNEQESNLKHPNPQSQFSPTESHNETQHETELNIEYRKLIQSFEALVGVTDPVRFEIEFEKEQRQSGLRLGTFKAAYRAWLSQQKGGQK